MFLHHEQMESYINENLICSEDESGKYFYCAICQISSRKRKQVIERHIESNHIVTEPFKCEICGSCVKSRRCLQIHMSKKHN